MPADPRMNWVDCHAELSRADTDRGALVDSRYSSFDSTCLDAKDDEAELLNVALANQGFNFMSVPSSHHTVWRANILGAIPTPPALKASKVNKVSSTKN